MMDPEVLLRHLAIAALTKESGLMDGLTGFLDNAFTPKPVQGAQQAAPQAQPPPQAQPSGSPGGTPMGPNEVPSHHSPLAAGGHPMQTWQNPHNPNEFSTGYSAPTFQSPPLGPDYNP